MMSKKNSIFVGIVLLSVLLHINSALGATYTVGAGGGWKFDVAGWENDKSFKAGDKLVFKYNLNFHNVVIVNKTSYDSCIVPEGAKKFTSGYDKLTLAQGGNYFICGFPGHCAKGMKIAANAAPCSKSM